MLRATLGALARICVKTNRDQNDRSLPGDGLRPEFRGIIQMANQQADAAEAFIQSIGVNTHLDFRGGPTAILDWWSPH